MQREGQAHSPTKSGWDSAVLDGLVQARDGGEAIPPFVARIFSGDSTSPLTREASVVVRGDGCAFEKVVGMERLVGDPSVLRQIGLIEY